jgi:predicted ATPase
MPLAPGTKLGPYEILSPPGAVGDGCKYWRRQQMRGVKVVVETHSALILLGIQALVAEGFLIPEMVKLHWFSRGPDGKTKIESADMAEDGGIKKNSMR